MFVLLTEAEAAKNLCPRSKYIYIYKSLFWSTHFQWMYCHLSLWHLEILGMVKLSLSRQHNLDREKGIIRDYDSGEEAGFLRQSDTWNAAVNCFVFYYRRLLYQWCGFFFFFLIIAIIHCITFLTLSLGKFFFWDCKLLVSFHFVHGNWKILFSFTLKIYSIAATDRQIICSITCIVTVSRLCVWALQFL